jgi:hypothetical protein
MIEMHKKKIELKKKDLLIKRRQMMMQKLLKSPKRRATTDHDYDSGNSCLVHVTNLLDI